MTTATLKLYDYPLSGNCFKVRQMLAWLGVAYQTVPVDFFPGREHKSAAFLASVNPLGQLPVIDDDGFVLRDAQAILVYLASRYDPQGRWYPDEPSLRGEVAQWLATADELTRTASAARLHDALGYHHLDIDACRTGARAVFRVLDDHLAERATEGLRWLASAPEPTIADLACFPYVALAGEGGISLDEFPALRNWVWDFRHLPGFIGMSGIFPAGPA
ncbi:glutathione S-transferase [Variovorax sp. SG517]|uniref:glutathione S-transferase family protein n=1 Tax=Variovorax sp. SG517 TaxID=2587117 RepID=UPI00159E08B3|nr:glutathione S-transferase family protein [Variovorax sp. SG517]NVM91214.1 glutathione S-transferase [Variovorax sp. SG517]